MRQHVLPKIVVQNAIDSGVDRNGFVAPAGEGEGIGSEITHAHQVGEERIDDSERLPDAALTQGPGERAPTRIVPRHLGAAPALARLWIG